MGSRNLDQVYDVGDQGGHHVLWIPELWDKSRDSTHLNWRPLSNKRTPSGKIQPFKITKDESTHSESDESNVSVEC